MKKLLAFMLLIGMAMAGCGPAEESADADIVKPGDPRYISDEESKGEAKPKANQMGEMGQNP